MLAASVLVRFTPPLPLLVLLPRALTWPSLLHPMPMPSRQPAVVLQSTTTGPLVLNLRFGSWSASSACLLLFSAGLVASACQGRTYSFLAARAPPSPSTFSACMRIAGKAYKKEEDNQAADTWADAWVHVAHTSACGTARMAASLVHGPSRHVSRMAMRESAAT